MERDSHTLGKSMGNYIQVLSHEMRFPTLYHAMRNWLKSSCIFHAIEHTTE